MSKRVEKMRKGLEAGNGEEKKDIIDTGVNGGGDYTDNARKASLRKSIVRIAAATVLILAVIGAGAVLVVSIYNHYTMSNQTDYYYEKAGSIQNDIVNNLPVFNDKFAVERLNTFFTKDEVYSFAYNLWQYDLLINGNPVDKATANLTLKPGDKIAVRESLTQTLLPKDFVSAGNLTRGDANDSMKNHFGFGPDKLTYQLTETKDGFVTTYTADNLELKSGTTFNILFSFALEERLAFDRDVMVVNVS